VTPARRRADDHAGGRPARAWHAGAVRLVLVGPPGSGKGTQGPVLAAHLGVPHLSTGDLLRRQVEAGTELGRRVGEVIDRGDLVPDDLMIDVVIDALGGARGGGDVHDKAAKGGYILDGFPRTVAQAEMLEKDGSALPAPDLAVHLDIPDEVVHRRLEQRAIEEGRRDDADPEVLERRLQVYREETEPLIAHYHDRDALVTVDGDGPPDEVSARLLAAVNDFLRGSAHWSDQNREENP
jgi:adenylate kinase